MTGLHDRLTGQNMDSEHFPFIGDVAKAKMILLLDSGYSYNTHMKSDADIKQVAISRISDLIRANGYDSCFVNAESAGVLLNNYYFVFCRKIRQTF
jgi:hypothetical protein